MSIPKHDHLNSDNYTDFNMEMINKWIDEGIEWSKAISHEEYIKAMNGDWSILEDSTPKEWFSPLLNPETGKFNGTKLLGLASGGGQQMPVFVACGADCTIMDYSDRQLASEKLVAEREGYKINMVKGDMTKRFPFDDNSFDMIYHAVSNNYIEDIYHLWRECYRVLKPGGILIAVMVNSVAYIFDDLYDLDEIDENYQLVAVNKLPYNPLKDPALYEKLMSWNDDYNLEFSHSLEEQIGGQLKAGFILTEIKEIRAFQGVLSQYFPEYLSTRSVKPNTNII
jgi:Methylase involved in ubiquinone/menaquinone biosynthesis